MLTYLQKWEPKLPKIPIFIFQIHESCKHCTSAPQSEPSKYNKTWPLVWEIWTDFKFIEFQTIFKIHTCEPLNHAFDYCQWVANKMPSHYYMFSKENKRWIPQDLQIHISEINSCTDPSSANLSISGRSDFNDYENGSLR